MRAIQLLGEASPGSGLVEVNAQSTLFGSMKAVLVRLQWPRRKPFGTSLAILPTTWRPPCARSRFVYPQSLSCHLFAVQPRYGSQRMRLSGHLNEAESLGCT